MVCHSDSSTGVAVALGSRPGSTIHSLAVGPGCLSVLMDGSAQGSEMTHGRDTQLLATVSSSLFSGTRDVLALSRWGPAGPRVPGDGWSTKPSSHCHSPASLGHQKAGNWGGAGRSEGRELHPGSRIRERGLRLPEPWGLEWRKKQPWRDLICRARLTP